MIVVVECQKCGTRFQLDPARIPESGIRVRCSRCKHAFHLQNPNISEADAIHAVASEAAENAETIPPGTTQDLPIHQRGGAVADSALHDPVAPPAAPEPPAVSDEIAGLSDIDDIDGLDDDEEWEFNQELPTAEGRIDIDDIHDIDDVGGIDGLDDINVDEGIDGLDDIDVDEGIDDVGHDEIPGLEGESDVSGHEDVALAQEHDGIGLADDESSGLDLDMEESSGGDDLDLASANEPGPGSETAEPLAAATPDLEISDQSTDFSVVDDESAGANEPAPGFGGAREGDAFGSVDDFSSLMEADEAGPDAAVMDSGAHESAEAGGWDFFSDEELETPDANPFSIDPAPDFEAGATGAMQPNPRASAHANAARASMPRIDTSAAVGSMSRVVHAVLWVFSVALIVAGVSGGVALSLNTHREVPAVVEIGKMRATEVEGRWIETARAGTLYAVTGKLTNPAGVAAAPGLSLEVALLDAQRRPIANPGAVAGRGLSLDVVRELAPEALTAAEERSVATLALQPIAAGVSVPFVALLRDMPIEATSFELRAAEPPARAPAIVSPSSAAPISLENQVGATGQIGAAGDSQPAASTLPPAERASGMAGVAAGVAAPSERVTPPRVAAPQGR